MLKKTLIAAAVASMMSTSAFAMTLSTTDAASEVATTSTLGNVTIGNYTANVLASQTKQAVLDKTTFSGTVEAFFDQTQVTGTAEAELKDGGEIIYQLTGDAYFNADNVAALLTIPSTATAFDGVAVTIDSSVLAYDVTDSSLVADIQRLFKVVDDGTNITIEYSLDSDNQRLSLKLADAVANTDVAVDNDASDDGATTDDTEYLNSASVLLDFTASTLQQGLTLTEGTTSAVKLSVGALQNASYTADPISTPALFEFDDLFDLDQVELTADEDAVALVSDTYANWDLTTFNDSDGDGVEDGAFRAVTLHNNTTNQNIQHRYLTVSITGDFTGMATNTAGTFLLDSDGNATDWAVSGDTASITYSTETSVTTNTAGGDDLVLALPELVLQDDNTDALEAQEFTLTVTQDGSSATFNEYSQTIGNAFVVTRDGMKFDTVTTGTTSSNIIYIRDVSKVLPEDGGKIFVTITEYDAHDVDAQGEGTDLVTRVALPNVTLPSNGAVTLTPAGVAEALGVSINPSRQARFLFEVETNQGEAAVKKSTSEGVDIQTGAQDTVPVDFTL